MKANFWWRRMNLHRTLMMIFHPKVLVYVNHWFCFALQIIKFKNNHLFVSKLWKIILYSISAKSLSFFFSCLFWLLTEETKNYLSKQNYTLTILQNVNSVFKHSISMDKRLPLNAASEENHYSFVIIDNLSNYIITVPNPEKIPMCCIFNKSPLAVQIWPSSTSDYK